MKKYLLLFIATLLCYADMQAQMVFDVHVKNAEGVPLEGVLVYSFPIKKKGLDAYKQAMAEDNIARYFDKKKHDLLAEGKTDAGGVCLIRANSFGAIILDGGDCRNGIYDVILYNVEDCRKDNTNFRLDLILTGTDFSAGKSKKRKIRKDQIGEFANDGKAEQLGQADFSTSPTMPAGGTMAVRHGKDKIKITATVDISGEYARNDARCVVYPTIIFDDFKDSLTYMPPAVVQGKNYEHSLVRRMGYDVSRDKLNGYLYDKGLELKNNQNERILYSEWAKITKGTKYHIPALLWFEDYNNVYFEDSLLFSDGKEREPMRFLNWDAARKLSPINRSLFEIQGTYDPVNEAEDFKLSFEQGKSTLNLNDSVTVSERDSMIRWLANHYRGDSEIQKVVVRGFSSPEGSESVNRELSHKRARTIQQLLKEHFPNVPIEPEFNEFDNIVTWEEVANIMIQMDDTLARSYAMDIRNIIVDKKGFDAQYGAIRKNAALYDYLVKNVLNLVRFVQIEASVVVQKILTMDEIIERYNNMPDFRERMADYQYYMMMCHLADEENWDELYKVSKRAYERINKYKKVTKWLKLDPSAPADSLDDIDVWVPYPLAGYYYAVSSLQKGIVNKDILKPYLDDYVVGKRDGMPLNSLPYIVVQVLMCCEGEEFDAARILVEKYNLVSYPELEGLVMFVLCLNGEYAEDPKVRNYVMSTSPMNKAVILCAMGKYKEALETLYSSQLPNDDADVEYLKAICHFQSKPGNITDHKKEYFTGSEVYTPDAKPGIDTEEWAAPMLTAFELNEENVSYIENDGYFNNAYRQMVLYFHRRLKDGVSKERALAEYRALVARMQKNKDKYDVK